MNEVISSDAAPKAIGPYSQAIKSGGFVFASGQIPLQPDGTLLTGDIREQTKQVMENIGAILTAADLTYADIVQATIYVTNMQDFAAINEVYGGYFPADPPARATVGVATLPKGANVEIAVIAKS